MAGTGGRVDGAEASIAAGERDCGDEGTAGVAGSREGGSKDMGIGGNDSAGSRQPSRADSRGKAGDCSSGGRASDGSVGGVVTMSVTAGVGSDPSLGRRASMSSSGFNELSGAGATRVTTEDVVTNSSHLDQTALSSSSSSDSSGAGGTASRGSWAGGGRGETIAAFSTGDNGGRATRARGIGDGNAAGDGGTGSASGNSSTRPTAEGAATCGNKAGSAGEAWGGNRD